MKKITLSKDELRAKLTYLVEQGGTYKSIGEALGISASRASQYLQRFGLRTKHADMLMEQWRERSDREYAARKNLVPWSNGRALLLQGGGVGSIPTGTTN